DDVAAHVLARELDRERPGEGDERALRRRVRVLREGEAAERGDGADVDDRAATGTDQMRDAMLRDEERPFQVDRLHAVPVVLGRLEDGAVAVFPEDAGVVVEDVERAETLDGRPDDSLDITFERHVAHDRDPGAGRALD